MKDLMISLRLFIFMSLLLGVGYPLLMTAVAQSAFTSQAGGSLILKDRQIIALGYSLRSSQAKSIFAQDRRLETTILCPQAGRT